MRTFFSFAFILKNEFQEYPYSIKLFLKKIQLDKIFKIIVIFIYKIANKKLPIFQPGAWLNHDAE